MAQLEAALASEKAEKEAALAEKDAELVALREMIAERQRWRAQIPAAGAVHEPAGAVTTPR